MLLVAAGGPVLAKDTKKTVATLTTKYKPTDDKSDSNYVRAIIDKLEKATVDKATIQIKRGKDVFNYTVDVADIASAQPQVGGNAAKPGRIDFRLPVDFTDPKKP